MLIGLLQVAAVYMKKVENLRDSSKLDPLIFSAFFSLLRKPAEQAPRTAALLSGGAARALMQLDRTSCLDGEAGYAYRRGRPITLA